MAGDERQKKKRRIYFRKNNGRCNHCLSRNCNTRVACASCMHILCPGNIKFHGLQNVNEASNLGRCRYTPPTEIINCPEHQSPLLFKKLCESCHPDLLINSLNSNYGNIGKNPNYLATVYERRNGVVLQNNITGGENIEREDNNEESANNEDQNERNNNNEESDHFEDEGNERHIITKIKDNNMGNIRYEINPPSHCVPASAYMLENKSRVVRAISDSDKISYQNTYRVFLSCYSLYNREHDGVVETSYITHCTKYTTIRAYHEGMTEDSLNDLITDLLHREEYIEKIMSGSGWTYMKTTSIDLTFSRILGRNVRKSIGNYQKYPEGRRGKDCIINPNPYYFPRSDDVCPGPKNARCVTLATKVHLMLNSIEDKDERNKALNHMCRKRNGSFLPAYTNKMNQQTVRFPTKSKKSGNFFASQWRKLQKMNGFPICVYNLEKSINNKENVNISCIFAPSQSTLKKYEHKPICHLLQISKTHVVYIPDIQVYFKQIFGEKRGKNENEKKDENVQRCRFCFSIFKCRDGLLTHLQRATCLRNTSQPPKTTLVENAIIKHFMLKNTTTPELQIMMDMESIIKKSEPNTENKDTDDFSSCDTDGNYPNDHERPPIKEHIPFSLGFLPIDDKYQSLGYETISGENIGEKMLDKIDEIITKHREKVREKRFLKPSLTAKDQILFDNQTHCMFCQVSFASLGNSKYKHRHHNHKQAPVTETVIKNNGSRYEKVVKGNYLGAACHKCNWQVTNLRNTVVCLFHNGGNYDYPILMKEMVKDKSKVKKIKISPKGANCYYYLRYKDAKFIDSCSFLSAPLSSLVETMCKDMDTNKPELTLPLTIKSLKESRFNNEVIPYLFRKLVYPYGLAQSVEDFQEIKIFPKKEDFYDDLAESHVSEKDYQYAKEVWEKAGCKNLQDFHDLYLMADTCMLGDVWTNFSKMVFKDFGLVTSNFTTGPSLIYKAALKMGKTDIKLIDNMFMYETFEGMLRGGYCCATQRRVVCNNCDLENYDPSKDDIKFKLIDFNSLYAGCLRENLPIGNFEYLAKEEVAKCECEINGKNYIMQLDSSKFAKKGYVFTVDIEIPNDLKNLVDDYPLGLVNTISINPSEHTKGVSEKGGQEKLIAGHFDLCRYSFDIRLLKFYLDVGCKITKIHEVISFDQRPVFKNYIDHCINKRKEAIKNENSVEKQHYKLMCNALYGRTILNDRNFATNTRLVNIGDELAKAQGMPNFKSVRFISKHIAAVTANKKEIILNSPIFIGATVLQLSKLKNYEFHYKVVKPSCASFPKDRIQVDPKDKEIIEESRKYIEDITLIYSDTDSLGYKITMTEEGKGKNHEFLYTNTFLRHYLDRSNFNILPRDGLNEAGGIGFLKSEVGDDIVKEIICLAPKCYSIETKQRIEQHSNTIPQTNHKQAIKGCPSKVAGKFYPHSVFQNILEQAEYKVPEASTNHIRRNKHSGVQTVRLTRTSLSLYDNKRYWVDDFTSYAYGHEKTGYEAGCILTVKGGYIKGTEDKLLQTQDFDNTVLYEYDDDDEDDVPDNISVNEENTDENNATTEPTGNMEDMSNWGVHEDGEEEDNDLVYSLAENNPAVFSSTCNKNKLSLKRKYKEAGGTIVRSEKKSKRVRPFHSDEEQQSQTETQDIMDVDENEEDFFCTPNIQTNTEVDKIEQLVLTPPHQSLINDYIYHI